MYCSIYHSLSVKNTFKTLLKIQVANNLNTNIMFRFLKKCVYIYLTSFHRALISFPWLSKKLLFIIYFKVFKTIIRYNYGGLTVSNCYPFEHLKGLSSNNSGKNYRIIAFTGSLLELMITIELIICALL